MKRIFSTLLAASTTLPVVQAELEDDIPLGIEAVTGVRSGYVYRGFELADTLMDFQLQTEVVLEGNLVLGAGGWFATETGDQFTQGAAFLSLRHDLHEQLAVEFTTSYQDFGGSLFEDGIDLGGSLTWFPDEDWTLAAAVHQDLGPRGWYLELQGGWSKRLADDAYFSLTGGFSVVDHYYGRSGLNDFHGRAALTYNVNSMLSLTPFVGWSLEFADGDGSEVYGGLWFEVSF